MDLFRILNMIMLGACLSLSADYAFYGGPEIYHLKWTRADGAHERGTLYGGRFGVDRLNTCAWYWGGDFYFADGYLDGRSGRGKELNSMMQDFQIEGRFGYRFGMGCFSLTPIIGLGYFREVNTFAFRSCDLKFRTTFPFSTVGLFADWRSNCFSVGIHFKARFMFGARKYKWLDFAILPGPSNQVIGHPTEGTFTQIIANEVQYVVDLPITYTHCHVAFSLVPFYRLRHYGFCVNYPAHFIETKINIWGARFLFTLCW